MARGWSLPLSFEQVQHHTGPPRDAGAAGNIRQARQITVTNVQVQARLSQHLTLSQRGGELSLAIPPAGET